MIRTPAPAPVAAPAPLVTTTFDYTRLYAAVITLALIAGVVVLLVAHVFDSPELNGILVGLLPSALAFWAKMPGA